MAQTTQNLRTEQFTTHDLYLENLKNTYQTMSLNGHTFWVNPNQCEITYERIHQERPTQNGVGRFSYGVKSVQYVISGFTGNAGLQEITNRQTGMGSFVPDFRNQTDKSYILTFSAQGIKNRKVYVDYFRHWMDNSMPQYQQYEIHLQEFAPKPPPYPQVYVSGGGILRS